MARLDLGAAKAFQVLGLSRAVAAWAGQQRGAVEVRIDYLPLRRKVVIVVGQLDRVRNEETRVDVESFWWFGSGWFHDMAARAPTRRSPQEGQTALTVDMSPLSRRPFACVSGHLSMVGRLGGAIFTSHPFISGDGLPDLGMPAAAVPAASFTPQKLAMGQIDAHGQDRTGQVAAAGMVAVSEYRQLSFALRPFQFTLLLTVLFSVLFSVLLSLPSLVPCRASSLR